MASCFAYTINGMRQATTTEPGVMAHVYIDDDGVQVATPNGVATNVTWAELDHMDSLQFTAYYNPGLYGFPVAPNTIMAATGALATALTIRNGTDAARVALITEGRERAIADVSPDVVENVTYDVPTPTRTTYVAPYNLEQGGANVPSPGEIENLTYDVPTPAASYTTPYVLPSDIMPYSVSSPLHSGDASPYAVSSLQFVADIPPQPPAGYRPRTPAPLYQPLVIPPTPPYQPPAIPPSPPVRYNPVQRDDMTDILRNTLSARRAAMNIDDD